MLTIPSISPSSVQAPANETPEITVDPAPTLQSHTTASMALNGIEPHGGLHPVARAATAADLSAELQRLQQMMEALRQLLQNLQSITQNLTKNAGPNT
jgi:hypothetical protein